MDNDGVMDRSDGQERGNDWAILSRAIVSALPGNCSMHHVHRMPVREHGTTAFVTLEMETRLGTDVLLEMETRLHGVCNILWNVVRAESDLSAHARFQTKMLKTQWRRAVHRH